MAQPRGGPLPFGHKSHQTGLDVDIWFMPMPDRVLSKEERENILASDMVAADGKHVNDKIWSNADVDYRLVEIDDLGFEYSIHDRSAGADTRIHQTSDHYIFQRSPVIVREFFDLLGNPLDRNDPCPCGSGGKFKHCHGILEAGAVVWPTSALGHKRTFHVV